MKSLIDIITEYAGSNQRMDAIALENDEYKKLLSDIDIATANFPPNNAVNKIIAAHNAANAYYSQKCYQQGLMDCITFLKELKIL